MDGFYGRLYLSVLQFLPQLAAALYELELAGLGTANRELLLGHLRKVGNPWRSKNLKDRRNYSRPEGGETVRSARTWREAHRVLVELEETQDSTRAFGGSG